MSLSGDAQPEASNGHAEPAAAAAAVPAAAEGADTAAGADGSSAGTSSAPAGLPQTQDELIEVPAMLLQDITCNSLYQHVLYICIAHRGSHLQTFLSLGARSAPMAPGQVMALTSMLG